MTEVWASLEGGIGHMAERYDIAIVGTGPAGLEAAITAKLRNKNIILFGNSDLSLKITRATRIDNYLGLPDTTGEKLAEAYKAHLVNMGIEIVCERINEIYAMGDYFALQSAETMYEAKSVILATGVVTGKTIDGELENLGRGVSYCATCDAALYKGKTAVVLSYSKKEEEEADFLAERAEKVYYLPIYREETDLNPEIEVVKGVIPKQIIRRDDKMVFVTNKGEFVTDGIFILRDAVAPDKLVPGLKTDGAHIVVNREMETNIPGLFACGDITGRPYQYIKAAGEGNVASFTAVSYLSE